MGGCTVRYAGECFRACGGGDPVVLFLVRNAFSFFFLRYVHRPVLAYFESTTSRLIPGTCINNISLGVPCCTLL